MHCDDLEWWDAGRVAGRLNREEIHVYLELIHTVVQQKPTQHCKPISLQLKKKNNNPMMSTHIPKGSESMSQNIFFFKVEVTLPNNSKIRMFLVLQHVHLLPRRSIISKLKNCHRQRICWKRDSYFARFCKYISGCSTACLRASQEDASHWPVRRTSKSELCLYLYHHLLLWTWWSLWYNILTIIRNPHKS